MELIEADDARTPWTGGGVDATIAIRGLHSVRLTVDDTAPTVAFMKQLLGFTEVGEDERRVRVAVGGTGSGHLMEIVATPTAPVARNGLGTVHHVAMAVADRDTQDRIRRELLAAGAQVTSILDRQYFTSIYFREPGGILFEIATLPPGFTVDEPLADLGQGLKLPPWEEPNRAAIAAGLAPIVLPRADA